MKNIKKFFEPLSESGIEQLMLLILFIFLILSLVLLGILEFIRYAIEVLCL